MLLGGGKLPNVGMAFAFLTGRERVSATGEADERTRESLVRFRFYANTEFT